MLTLLEPIKAATKLLSTILYPTISNIHLMFLNIQDFLDYMTEEHGIEEYPYCIYTSDDDDLLFDDADGSSQNAGQTTAFTPAQVAARARFCDFAAPHASQLVVLKR